MGADSGCKAYGLVGIHDAMELSLPSTCLQAHPVLVQLGGRLTRSAPYELWRNICLSNAVVRFNMW